MPVEDLVRALRAGFFVLPAIAFVMTRRACIALQRRDRRRLRQGTEFGITAMREGTAYAAVAPPATGEERAVMEARRPDELFMPIPRHLVPLPTPRRALARQPRAAARAITHPERTVRKPMRSGRGEKN